MDLADLRTEVENRGFDATAYGTRINQWINDAQNLIARRVDYYVDEATDTISTVSGTATYPWPSDFARMRSVFDTVRNIELQFVSVRDIDQSPVRNGAPFWYALVGENITLYPTPDQAYSLEMRYWKMPAALSGDTDTPNLPADWHWLLWTYAAGEAYLADDDPQTAQVYQQKFTNGLSMLAADVKFPSTDGPNQARGMWEPERILSQYGWPFTAGGW